MNATITTTGETVKGKTIKEIRSQLLAMLKIEGFQGLTAITENGTEIHVELFDGQDYIWRAASALGSIKTERKAKSSRENGKKGGRPRNPKTGA